MRKTSSHRWVAVQLGLAFCLMSPTLTFPAHSQTGNPSRAEFPGRRIGGGTRGECLANRASLIALNPANNLGVTASARPSVYFAIPALETTYPVKFTLRDRQNRSVYETTLSLAQGQSLLGVQLPANTVQTGQDYQWYFSVVCDAEDASQNIVLSGWMRRVAQPPNPSTPAGVEAALAQAMAYQAAGLSSDAIATLAQLRQTHPTHAQVERQWQQLMQSLGLETVVNSTLRPALVGRS